MRVALLADFPVHTLPGLENRQPGHHATWLPPLARELEAYTGSIEFHWITCTKEVTQPQVIRTWNQTFHLIPRAKLSLEILTAFHRERRLIARLIHEIQPDIVHGWGTEQGYGYAANDFNGPSLISLQGILQTYCKAAAMPLLTRLQALHEARVLRQAKHLTVESPWGESQLQQLAPHTHIDLLEYGVDPACFEIQRNLPPIPSPDQQSTISNQQSAISNSPSSFQHLIPPSGGPPAGHVANSYCPSRSTRFSNSASQHLPAKPLALFVGSITRLKGIDTLLDAFCDPRLHHIELAILGSIPPEIGKLKLPPNIRLLGHRSPSDVRNWMSKAWCLVHPTRADTSPNCVKEARGLGLPVVTTPEGGQTQYVQHGESGFIHPAGDVEGLIQGILAVTATREISIKMGAAGHTECSQVLHPATTASRLITIYQRPYTAGCHRHKSHQSHLPADLK